MSVHVKRDCIDVKDFRRSHNISNTTSFPLFLVNPCPDHAKHTCTHSEHIQTKATTFWNTMWKWHASTLAFSSHHLTQKCGNKRFSKCACQCYENNRNLIIVVWHADWARSPAQSAVGAAAVAVKQLMEAVRYFVHLLGVITQIKSKHIDIIHFRFSVVYAFQWYHHLHPE